MVEEIIQWLFSFKYSFIDDINLLVLVTGWVKGTTTVYKESGPHLWLCDLSFGPKSCRFLQNITVLIRLKKRETGKM